MQSVWRAAAVFMLAVVVTGCGPSGTSPKSIAEAAGPEVRLRSVVPNLQITAVLPKQADATAYVSELAALSRRLARAVQAKVPDLPSDVTALNVNALRPDIDDYGNERNVSFAVIDFDIATLKSAHVDQLGDLGVLNLAKLTQPLPYQSVIDAWCQSHDGAPNFCKQASLGEGAP